MSSLRLVQRCQKPLDDGMHPNGNGVGVMVEKMLPTAEAFVKSLGGSD